MNLSAIFDQVHLSFARSVMRLFLAAACVHLAAASAAHAQDYPNRPVRLITSEPGGSSDVAARIIAQRIPEFLGQPLVVENRPGIIAVETVAHAPADGYTTLLYGTVIWLAPFLRDNVAWDPIKDFAPVTMVVSTPNVLVVHPSLRTRTVKELIALARARPGELNYASVGSGSTQHLAGELFKSMAKVDIVGVPFKGGGLALNALVGGQVQLMFPTAATAMPFVKSGRLTALAVTSLKPTALAPGLPTVSDSGLPGYESVSILGMMVPARTPPAIVSRLNRDVVRVLSNPEIKEKFFAIGADTAPSTPEAFAAAIRSDMQVWGKLIKEAHIRAE